MKGVYMRLTALVMTAILLPGCSFSIGYQGGNDAKADCVLTKTLTTEYDSDGNLTKKVLVEEVIQQWPTSRKLTFSEWTKDEY